MNARRLALPGTILFIAVYGAWQLMRWGGHAHQALIGDLTFLPMNGAAMAYAWLAGSRCSGQPRLRTGWRLISLGLLGYVLGDVVQTLYEGWLGQKPYPSIGDAFYLSFYPLALAGLLRFRVGKPSRAERRKLLIDSALVVIGGGALVWYVVLGPTAISDSGSTLQTIFSIAYPVGDLVLLLGLANLLLRRMAPSVRRPVGWIAFGLAFWVVADLFYGWQSLKGAYHGGDPVDTLWMVAIGAFLVAAAAQPRAGGAEDDPAAATDTHGWAWIPYVGATIVFGLIVVSDIGEPFFPGMSLTLSGMAVAVLVGIRQFLSHRELVEAHAGLAAAHAELAGLATTDPVTALPNHRSLIATIDRELERSRRYRRSCALFFIDIDHFKSINDAWGHPAGDVALRELGFVAGDALRGMDTIGRWGGEEFVALLPEMDASDALQAAERLRHAIARHRFAAAGGVHLTCSIGVAVFPDDGDDREALIATADRAMYTAKHLGRNQAIAAADPAVRALSNGGTRQPGQAEVALMDAVETIAQLVDVRDNYTGAHAADVAAIARRLTLLAGGDPDTAQTVGMAARLHDVGKVAIADAILQKPGRLTDEEWEQMRRHPVLGAEVVSRIPNLRGIAPLVRGHHERWDGGGYPDGLAGDEIPIGARVIAIADAYDAMITGRPYREAISHDDAIAELERCAGTQFDPQLVALMRTVLEPPRDAVEEPVVA